MNLNLRGLCEFWVFLSVVCGLWLTIPQGVRAQDAMPLPQHLQAIVERALRQAPIREYSIEQIEPFRERRRRVDEAGRLFAQTLDELALYVDDTLAEYLKELEGRNIGAKLVAIALDRKSHPNLYEEIEQTYIKGVDDPRNRAPASPFLQKVHATEKYRLVWEYFVLTPPPADASFKHDFRATEALQEIRNNASLVTLVYSYEITTGEGVRWSEFVEDHQRLLLGTISALSNEQALRAMLECVSLSKKQRDRIGSDKSYWDVEGYVSRLLTDQENYGNGEQWHQVITAFPRAELPEGYRQLLERALQSR